MKDFMERRITSPKKVTSPTWDPPPPCKQALRICSGTFVGNGDWKLQIFFPFTPNVPDVLSFNISHFLFLFFFLNHER